MPPDQDQLGYVSFWDRAGATFPSLKGAESTLYYLECEQRLFEEFVPCLRDLLLLKTDLWNEAKSTEILRWAAEQGARPMGVDITFEIVCRARKVLKPYRPGCLVADTRSLPFPNGVFDLIYSMGTIEHFPDYEVAIREIFRVLRPGGTAIVGVPNKLDPFLRPLLVWLLNRAGLYAYGLEKSFTPRALRRLLDGAGFRVTARTGILFIPGWLRMLDLLCHTRFPPLAPFAGLLVRPFSWIYRHIPVIRRHGYLTVAIAKKPPAWSLSPSRGHLEPALEASSAGVES